MAIFVEHKDSGELFVLVGTGFGAFQSARQGEWKREGGNFPMVCVSDKNGNLGWLRSESIKVINIDGTDIKDLEDLGEFDEKAL